MFQHNAMLRNVLAAALLLLLGVGMLMPVSGGLLLLRHRAIRQNALARSASRWKPVDIILSDSMVGRCFQADKGELEYGGLRYDVVKMERNGQNWIFKAVPDRKESEMMKAGRPVLFPGGVAPVSYGFSDLYYLGEYPFELLPNPISRPRKSAFFSKKVAEIAGFKGDFSPPPEVCRNSV